MQGIDLVKLSDDDLELFQKYVNETFHSKYILNDPTYINWQFDGLYVVKTKEGIVGHFGYKDTQFTVNGKEQTVRIPMSLFVLEKYRVFGLGAMLTKKVLDVDSPIIISGHNDFSDRVVSHFRPDWKSIGAIKRYFLVLNGDNHFFNKFTVPEQKAEFKQSGDFTFKSLKSFDVDADKLWASVCDRYPVTAVRSKEYLNWRFSDHPYFDYSILAAYNDKGMQGHLIWKYEEVDGFKIARIIDFIALELVEKELLAAFLKETKNNHADAVDFMFTGDFYEDSLSSVGFFETEANGFQDFPILFGPISLTKKYIRLGYDFKVPVEKCFMTKAEGDQDRPNPH